MYIVYILQATATLEDRSPMEFPQANNVNPERRRKKNS